MVRRALLAAALSLSFACGGGAPATNAPEGRCETDADCPEGQRCAMVATICRPPYCGFCVDEPR
jgi:hypothetical protein